MSVFKDSLAKWSNEDNQEFYNQMPIEKFKYYAVSGGVETGEDVRQIKTLVQQAKTILEIGCGYGRILVHNFTGKINAIERNDFYYEYCSKKYSNDKIEIFHDNIMTWKFGQMYDLILWMWSSIAEFFKEE